MTNGKKKAQQKIRARRLKANSRGGKCRTLSINLARICDSVRRRIALA